MGEGYSSGYSNGYAGGFAMTLFTDARARIAAVIGAVAISEPATASLYCYETRPDGGEGLNIYPNVLITGARIDTERAMSIRERTYTFGLRLACKPIGDAGAAELLEAFKDAMISAFDTALALNDLGGATVITGPNWIDKEYDADGGTVWTEAELVIILTDAPVFAS